MALKFIEINDLDDMCTGDRIETRESLGSKIEIVKYYSRYFLFMHTEFKSNPFFIGSFEEGTESIIVKIIESMSLHIKSNSGEKNG